MNVFSINEAREMGLHRYDKVMVIPSNVNVQMLDDGRTYLNYTTDLRAMGVKQVSKEPEEYKMYESHFSDIWYDSTKIGLCGDCGMDDSPIAYGGAPAGTTKTAIIAAINELKDADFHQVARCLYCAELSNLNYHLRYNGTRRFRNTSKWSYDGDPDTIGYSKWLEERKAAISSVAPFYIFLCLVVSSLIALMMGAK